MTYYLHSKCFQKLLFVEMFSPSGHTKCTVDGFVPSSEQIWRNVAIHHLLTNGSSAVNGCRQNESPNSWEKHHDNPQLIHTTPVHQLTSCDSKSRMFAWTNSSRFLLTSNHCFQLKYKFSIYNEAQFISKIK